MIIKTPIPKIDIERPSKGYAELSAQVQFRTELWHEY